MLEKDLQRKCEAYERINRDDKLLEEMINRKGKKIKESKKELQKKESELESAQKNIKALQKELAQAHQELKKEQDVMEKLQLKVEILLTLAILEGNIWAILSREHLHLPLRYYFNTH